jgi:predicted dehydrogenase
MAMKTRLKVGVAGGGLIAQVEHIPNLLALADRFELVAVSDPSPPVRAGLTSRFGVACVPDVADLLGMDLDAVLIAAPDPWHGEIAADAMRAGMHVFCEKPLCYGVAEIDALDEARRRSGVTLQVGYMKRFDPSYEAACRLIAGKGERLRYVSVEVNDPDAGPFVGHHPLIATTDVPAALIEATAERRRAQIQAALGFEPKPVLARGFASSLCSSMVHDVNAVHGLLDAMDLTPGSVRGATIFAGGAASQATVDLRDGAALWNMAHVEIPGVGDYRERISLYFEDEIVELVFPAPYLNHHPTALSVRRAAQGDLEKVEIRSGFSEPFVTELESFWSAIVEGTPQRNPLAEARRDQALLIAMARIAADPAR